jgi:N-sulfoglucosamine sulfohydrolase
MHDTAFRLGFIRILFSFFLTSLCYAGDRPNILWLTSEDNNVNWVGCYGNPEASTPHIDQLAEEGFLYERCYANVPVCAPQRSTWIMGAHALSIGTVPMRSRYAISHDQIRYYPDFLREAGYHVSNNGKTDFNIGGRKDEDCWDSMKKYGWRDRQPGQPFFCIVNTGDSHESRAHRTHQSSGQHDPADSQLRSYHPDLPEIRANYAKYRDAVSTMDQRIGEHIAELEKDGLLEDTIIIYNSDHGGVMTRSKRYLFESGLHCPLVVRIPEKFKHLWPAEAPGNRIGEIVSFIDMPATWLALAGVGKPEQMQGRAFLGEDLEPERQLHFAYRSRMDERTDSQRAVHDGRYLYIKNYMPFAPWGQYLEYLWKQDTSTAWEAHHKAGLTNALTGRFFGTKPTEELYDTQADPDCVVNLADQADQRERLAQFRKDLREWQLNVFDSEILPESMLTARADSAGLTRYELLRLPDLYDLPAYLDAADKALGLTPAKLCCLKELAASADPGVRYWAAVGLMMQGTETAGAEETILALMQDTTPEVRTLAAWAAYKLGRQEQAIDVLREVIQSRSDAVLLALNVLDYMGEPAKILLPEIKDLSYPDPNAFQNYILRMRGNLIKMAAD